MRPCWSTGNSFIKIKLKPVIKHEIICGNLRDMDFVVAFSMDFPSLVLVQKIIRNDDIKVADSGKGTHIDQRWCIKNIKAALLRRRGMSRNRARYLRMFPRRQVQRVFDRPHDGLDRRSDCCVYRFVLIFVAYPV